MQANNRWFVAVTIFLSLLLAVMPLPQQWLWFRPAFPALLVIFWITQLPQALGVGFAWMVGILEDLATGASFGTHALALAVLAYFSLLTYQRTRAFNPLQQLLWAFVLVGINQVVGNWVHGLEGKTVPGLTFLWPALTTALLWPWVASLLRGMSRRLGIH
ncbi:rod shape-determining protein MreD [Microbulbifer sp. 2205BS26-8]|uniref:rod shape-determining protein MreD n=1 Tax=Microbulbifer sp. 2205BS26-8 TaxID=3064386 RepID=UPI00273CF8B9|nr:rod shape-determining protein MreD [Microbulbifer sp. 2205BS26-8]MDP5209478.1 rod shape-determining protein MreD [Microbulbifer sp. 2205BS26-8]